MSMSETSNNTTGRVKWFNKSAGYGFITAVNGVHEGNDIFVHHSKLCVSNEQFRYLVDGEYVLFEWSPSDVANSKHEYQASNIRGIYDGPLMCETQNENRGDEKSSVGNARTSTAGDRRRHRGGGPKITDGDGNEYKLVRNSRGRSKAQHASEE